MLSESSTKRNAVCGLSEAIERNLREVGLGEPSELASSPRHSARQPPKFVFYAGKYFFGWEGPARSPTLLDCPTDIVDAELARLRVLIAADEVAHIVADACVVAAFDPALHPLPHGFGTDMFIEAIGCPKTPVFRRVMSRSSDHYGKFSRLMPRLPPDPFVRAAEALRHVLVMRKVVDDGPDGELALRMKGRLEFVRREQESVHAAQVPREDIDEEPRAAFAAGEAGVALQFPIQRVAADHFDRVGRIDGFRRIGAAVHGLTIVAMARTARSGQR